ncbi:MAG: hypothetical protein GX589_10865, partial [Deltaproteobacteria bacterium]|nr:hypothetical protein [Deltaproteobacteria bacterium]
NRRTPPLDTGSQQLSAPLWSWGEVTLSPQVSDWLDKVYVDSVPSIMVGVAAEFFTCFRITEMLAGRLELKELQTEVSNLASAASEVLDHMKSIPGRLSKEELQRDNMCRILARSEIPEAALELKSSLVKLRAILKQDDFVRLAEEYEAAQSYREGGDGSEQDPAREANMTRQIMVKHCETLIYWFDKLSDPHESSGSCELNNTLAWLFSANEGVKRHVSLSLPSEKQVVALPLWVLRSVMHHVAEELIRIRSRAHDMPLCELSLEDLSVFESGSSDQAESPVAKLIAAARDADNELIVMVDCNGAIRMNTCLMSGADDAVLDQWGRELASRLEQVEAFLAEIGGKLSTGVGRGDNSVGCYVSIHLPRATELDHIVVGIETSEEPSYKNLLGGALQPIVFKVCGGSGKGQLVPPFQVQAPSVILRTEEARRWVSKTIFTTAWLGASGMKIDRLYVEVLPGVTQPGVSGSAGEFLPRISQGGKEGRLTIKCEWDGHDQKLWAESSCGISMRQEMFNSSAMRGAILNLAKMAEIRSLHLPSVICDKEEMRASVEMLDSARYIAAKLKKVCGGKPIINIAMEENNRAIELPLKIKAEMVVFVPTLRIFTAEGLQVYRGCFSPISRSFFGSVQKPALIRSAISKINGAMSKTFHLQDRPTLQSDDPYVEHDLAMHLMHSKVLAPIPFISQLAKLGREFAPGADFERALLKMFKDDWMIVESQRGGEWLAVEDKSMGLDPLLE